MSLNISRTSTPFSSPGNVPPTTGWLPSFAYSLSSRYHLDKIATGSAAILTIAFAAISFFASLYPLSAAFTFVSITLLYNLSICPIDTTPLTSKIQKLTQELDRAQQNMKTKTEEFTDKISILEKTHQTRGETLKQYEDREKTLKLRIKGLKEQIDDLNQKLVDKQKEYDDTIGDLKKKWAEEKKTYGDTLKRQTDIVVLDLENNEIDRRREELEKNVKKLEKDKTSLEQEIVQLKTDLLNIRAEVPKALEESQRLKDQQAALQEEYKSAEKTLDEKRKERDKSLETSFKLDEEIKRKETHLRKLEERFGPLEKQIPIEESQADKQKKRVSFGVISDKGNQATPEASRSASPQQRAQSPARRQSPGRTQTPGKGADDTR